MAKADWTYWSWATAAPPPTDFSTHGWLETTAIPSGHLNKALKWSAISQDGGEFVGRTYDGSGDTGKSFVKAGACVRIDGDWLGPSGVFVGLSNKHDGDLTGGTSQDAINGILVGPRLDTSGTPRLYLSRVTEGVPSHMGFKSVSTVGGTQFIQYEIAFVMDNTRFSLGGYNGGVPDADRPMGEPVALIYYRRNTGSVITPGYGGTGWSGWELVNQISYGTYQTLLDNIYKGRDSQCTVHFVERLWCCVVRLRSIPDRNRYLGAHYGPSRLGYFDSWWCYLDARGFPTHQRSRNR